MARDLAIHVGLISYPYRHVVQVYFVIVTVMLAQKKSYCNLLQLQVSSGRVGHPKQPEKGIVLLVTESNNRKLEPTD